MLNIPIRLMEHAYAKVGTPPPANLGIKRWKWMDLKRADVEVLFVEMEHKQCGIVYRGSDSNQDWLSNLDFGMTYVRHMDCWIHDGFYKTHRETSAAVHSAWLDFRQDCQGTLCLGHSRGHALAVLMATDLAQSGYICGYITAGGPRVGDAKFAKKAEACSSRIRWVAEGDPVTQVPWKAPPLIWPWSRQYVGVAGKIVLTGKPVEGGSGGISGGQVAEPIRYGWMRSTAHYLLRRALECAKPEFDPAKTDLKCHYPGHYAMLLEA